MSSEREGAKEIIPSTSSMSISIIVSDTKSKLPVDVLRMLQAGIRYGFREEELNIADMAIDDSMMPEICEWIGKAASKIKMLRIEGNKITSKGASTLFEALKKCDSSILFLNAGRNLLDDGCMKHLGEYINESKYLNTLFLDNNQITDKGIKILSNYLVENCSLRRLLLNANKNITNASIPLIMKMVEFSWIDTIEVYDTSITKTHEFLIPFAHNVIRHGSYKLDLSYMEACDDDMVKICEMMEKYGIVKLKEINFEGNDKVTQIGATVLFDTLRKCNSVVSSLNFSYSNLNDDCMKSLGEYLQVDQYLEHLDINCNQFTDKGVEMLSEYLSGNTKLDKLHIGDHENITDASSPFFICMARTTNITDLYVSSTGMSYEIIEDIEDHLAIPSSKREIPIKSNTKSAAKISQ